MTTRIDAIRRPTALLPLVALLPLIAVVSCSAEGDIFPQNDAESSRGEGGSTTPDEGQPGDVAEGAGGSGASGSGGDGAGSGSGGDGSSSSGSGGEGSGGESSVDLCRAGIDEPPASIYGQEGLDPALGWTGPQYNGVVYKTASGQELVVDIFLPKDQGDELVPVVVYTHGGGWITGSEDNIGFGYKQRVAEQLLDAGVAVVSVDYRLADNGNVMQDCVIDSKDAARFVTKYAPWYGIDPSRMAMWGDSAGAHIAMMVALTENDAFLGDEELRDCNDYTIGGVVSWYGPVSFRTEDVDLWSGRSLNGFAERIYDDETNADTQEAMRALVSPIVYYTQDSPPLHMVHGDLDATIPYAHVPGMQEHAESVGITTFSYLTVTGAGHNFRQQGDDPLDPPIADVVADTTAKLLSFL